MEALQWERREAVYPKQGMSKAGKKWEECTFIKQQMEDEGRKDIRTDRKRKKKRKMKTKGENKE